MAYTGEKVRDNVVLLDRLKTSPSEVLATEMRKNSPISQLKSEFDNLMKQAGNAKISINERRALLQKAQEIQKSLEEFRDELSKRKDENRIVNDYHGYADQVIVAMRNSLNAANGLSPNAVQQQAQPQAAKPVAPDYDAMPPPFYDAMPPPLPKVPEQQAKVVAEPAKAGIRKSTALMASVLSPSVPIENVAARNLKQIQEIDKKTQEVSARTNELAMDLRELGRIVQQIQGIDNNGDKLEGRDLEVNQQNRDACMRDYKKLAEKYGIELTQHEKSTDPKNTAPLTAVEQIRDAILAAQKKVETKAQVDARQLQRESSLQSAAQRIIDEKILPNAAKKQTDVLLQVDRNHVLNVVMREVMRSTNADDLFVRIDQSLTGKYLGEGKAVAKLSNEEKLLLLESARRHEERNFDKSTGLKIVENAEVERHEQIQQRFREIEGKINSDFKPATVYTIPDQKDFAVLADGKNIPIYVRPAYMDDEMIAISNQLRTIEAGTAERSMLGYIQNGEADYYDYAENQRKQVSVFINVALFKYPGLVNNVGKDGNTLLHHLALHATEANDYSLIITNLVAEFGIDPTRKNAEGKSVIDIALEKNDKKTLDGLKEGVARYFEKELGKNDVTGVLELESKKAAWLRALDSASKGIKAVPVAIPTVNAEDVRVKWEEAMRAAHAGVVVRKDDEKNVNVVDELLKAIEDLPLEDRSTILNTKDANGYVLLHYLAENNLDLDAYNVVERGGSPFVKDNQGKTPLDVAAIKGKSHVDGAIAQIVDAIKTSHKGLLPQYEAWEQKEKPKIEVDAGYKLAEFKVPAAQPQPAVPQAANASEPKGILTAKEETIANAKKIVDKFKDAMLEIHHPKVTFNHKKDKERIKAAAKTYDTLFEQVEQIAHSNDPEAGRAALILARSFKERAVTEGKIFQKDKDHLKNIARLEKEVKRLEKESVKQQHKIYKEHKHLKPGDFVLSSKQQISAQLRAYAKQLDDARRELANEKNAKAPRQERYEEKAFQFAQIAYSKGSLYAAFDLAVCFAEGKGCAKESNKAVELVRQILAHQPNSSKPESNRALQDLKADVVKQFRGNAAIMGDNAVKELIDGLRQKPASASTVVAAPATPSESQFKRRQP